MHHIWSGEGPTVEADTEWGADPGWARGFGVQEEPLCESGCTHTRHVSCPGCLHAPMAPPLHPLPVPAAPLTREARCTSLSWLSFGHLAGGTLASIPAKSSAFSIVRCHGKTRHRPACLSGAGEGTEMNRPSCALPTHCPRPPTPCRGASGGLHNHPAELSQPSGDHQIPKNIRLFFKHGGLEWSVICIS